MLLIVALFLTLVIHGGAPATIRHSVVGQRIRRQVEEPKSMENPTEVAYVISGADELGGHQTKMFHPILTQIIETTVQK